MSDVATAPVDRVLLRKMRAGGKLHIRRAAGHAAAWCVDRDGTVWKDLDAVAAVNTVNGSTGIRVLSRVRTGSDEETTVYTADPEGPGSRWTPELDRAYEEKPIGEKRAEGVRTEALARAVARRRATRPPAAPRGDPANDTVRRPMRPRSTPQPEPMEATTERRTVIIPPMGGTISRPALRDLIEVDKDTLIYQERIGKLPAPMGRDEGVRGRPHHYLVDEAFVAWLVDRGLDVEHEASSAADPDDEMQAAIEEDYVAEGGTLSPLSAPLVEDDEEDPAEIDEAVARMEAVAERERLPDLDPHAFDGDGDMPTPSADPADVPSEPTGDGQDDSAEDAVETVDWEPSGYAEMLGAAVEALDAELEAAATIDPPPATRPGWQGTGRPSRAERLLDELEQRTRPDDEDPLPGIMDALVAQQRALKLVRERLTFWRGFAHALSRATVLDLDPAKWIVEMLDDIERAIEGEE